jgi:hypothetical protein
MRKRPFQCCDRKRHRSHRCRAVALPIAALEDKQPASRQCCACNNRTGSVSIWHGKGPASRELRFKTPQLNTLALRVAAAIWLLLLPPLPLLLLFLPLRDSFYCRSWSARMALANQDRRTNNPSNSDDASNSTNRYLRGSRTTRCFFFLPRRLLSLLPRSPPFALPPPPSLRAGRAVAMPLLPLLNCWTEMQLGRHADHAQDAWSFPNLPFC